MNAQIAVAVAERVHPDAARVLARLLRNRRRALGTHVPAVVQPAERERERAPAVREADAQPREALEHAAEDQLRDGQRVLERVADDQREVVLREPLLTRERRRRMHEDRDAERLARLEEREQRGIVEVLPRRTRADLDRAESEALARVTELLDGEHDILKRDGGHAHEAVGMSRGDAGDEVVLHPREGLVGLRVGPVAEHDRRRRERLAIDAETCHVLEAPRRIPRAVVDRAEELAAGHQRAATVRLDDQPRPVAAAVPGREVVPAGRHDVRVQVNPHDPYLDGP